MCRSGQIQRENRDNAWRRNARPVSRRHEAAEAVQGRAGTESIDRWKPAGRVGSNEIERRSLHVDAGAVSYLDTIK